MVLRRALTVLAFALLPPGLSESLGRPAIVLLGPSGSGKSETGNTLSGRIAFNVSDGLESETRKPQSVKARVDNKEWQVVDTPGYFDTTLSSEEQDALLHQFAELVNGPIAALVFVVPYGRFGDAHLRAWHLTHDSFGPLALNHTVLAFTSCGKKSSQEVRDQLGKLCSKDPPPQFCEAIGGIPLERIIALGELNHIRQQLDREAFFKLVAAQASRGYYDLGEFLRAQQKRKLVKSRVAAMPANSEHRRLVEELLKGAEAGSRSYDEVLRALSQAEGDGSSTMLYWDFEDHTALGPFRPVASKSKDGWLQPIAVKYSSMKGFETSTKSGGKLMLHTGSDSGVRLNGGHVRMGEFRSEPFVLGRGDISWESTGSGGFVAVCRATSLKPGERRLKSDDDNCVEKRLRRESTLLVKEYLGEEDLVKFQGKSVVLKIVDDRDKGWGFVAMDNLRYAVMDGVEEPEAAPASNETSAAALSSSPPSDGSLNNTSAADPGTQ